MNDQQSGAVALLCLIPSFICGFPILLIVITALLPTYFERAKQTVISHPWQSFFLGLINFVFFFTIGAVFAEAGFAPIRLVAVLSLFIILPLMTVTGFATAAGLIGERVMTRFTDRQSRPVVSFIIGIVCLGLSALVPIVGWAILVIVLMIGFGASLLALFRRRNGVIPVDPQPESSDTSSTP
jgi:hypothetical protein